MRVLIGLPVYERAWILPYWFEKITKLDWPDEELGFCFLYGPSKDDTMRHILDYRDQHRKHFAFEIIEEPNERHATHSQLGTRHWTTDRYVAMSRMRNKLLDRVCDISPDIYFSLDSDILLENPDTLRLLSDDLSIYDLVGILVFMTIPMSMKYPSIMTWDSAPGGHAKRHTPYPSMRLFDADIVMAAKAMTKETFEKVRYYPHKQGEDLGFCAEAARHGLRIGCDSRIFGSHVMGAYHLPSYLVEGDPRQALAQQLEVDA